MTARLAVTAMQCRRQVAPSEHAVLSLTAWTQQFATCADVAVLSQASVYHRKNQACALATDMFKQYHPWGKLHTSLRTTVLFWPYCHLFNAAAHRRIPAASPKMQTATTAPQLSQQQQPPPPSRSPFQDAPMARTGSTTLEGRGRQGSGGLQSAGSRGSGVLQTAGRQGSEAVEPAQHQASAEEDDLFLTPDLPARTVKK